MNNQYTPNQSTAPQPERIVLVPLGKVFDNSVQNFGDFGGSEFSDRSIRVASAPKPVIDRQPY
jgi:hypothetical protein